ncbi:hypothetical protein QLQ12_36020 [Actinoplanes sp. NEAU-A12]|uniref:FXSXX-COOH protein n=1 Tax=Actinoplanes sandaracinus TaxID=3045177 RepID=A0ABT6WWA0_9ACTN|nr:hypothetical protein [Actinoplanes sandaracinus]MDI6104011.1 hypothetical protein [Actinoplanes sandaracinus]
MGDVEEPEIVSDLVDLSGLGPRAAEAMPDIFLVAALRRILREAGDLTAQYSAFDNHVAGFDDHKEQRAEPA